MPRIPDTAIKEAAPCRPEPPREPYQSDWQPVYPPVPEACPRCNGMVLTAYSETRCVNCGWVRQPLPLPQELTMQKSGPCLPKVIEVRR
mgnify:CR=1 FL=1